MISFLNNVTNICVENSNMLFEVEERTHWYLAHPRVANPTVAKLSTWLLIPLPHHISLASLLTPLFFLDERTSLMHVRWPLSGNLIKHPILPCTKTIWFFLSSHLTSSSNTLPNLACPTLFKWGPSLANRLLSWRQEGCLLLSYTTSRPSR